MPSKNFGGGIHTLVLGEEGTYIAGKLPSDVTVGGLCELLEIEGRPKWRLSRSINWESGPVEIGLFGQYTGKVWDTSMVRHRCAPKWQGQGDPIALSVAVAKDGSSVSIALPSGEGFVSGQPLLTASFYEKQLGQLVDEGGSRIILGRSHGGRPVEAVRLGHANAPQLVVLLGRQHPPEVTGVMAMDAFSLQTAKLVRSGAIDPAEFQFLIVLLLNPDGVARGHWRANLGGVDLNRDWGTFSQPETKAVGDWLSKLTAGVKPLLMLDFHSTNRNLFYVQGDEASAQGKAFLTAWLSGKENVFEGYPFKIEPRDTNSGSGTTKNWFNATYGIPAFTYEVGDDADPAAVRTAAEALAQDMIPALVSASPPVE